jgi:hypothetical protein
MEKLPEKIYFTKDWPVGQGWSMQFERRDEDDVEYTRSDSIFPNMVLDAAKQAGELRKQGVDEGVRACEERLKPIKAVYEKYKRVEKFIKCPDMWKAIKEVLGEE